MSDICKYECELLTEWLIEMLKNEGKYLEPILDIKSTVLIKDVCNFLQQDIHVFAFSVDILEEFITRKNERREEIDDPALTLVATIFICSKFTGDQDVKIQSFESILKKITGHDYDPITLKIKEMEILSVLDNKLPINNNVDDLKTFVAKFEKETRIKVSILSLCCEILEMMYLTKFDWFHSLKSLYTNTDEALEVFKKLIKNRYYLPIGILVYVFKITSYVNSLDVDNIMADLSRGTQIHVDHFNALITKIGDVVNIANGLNI